MIARFIGPGGSKLVDEDQRRDRSKGKRNGAGLATRPILAGRASPSRYGFDTGSPAMLVFAGHWLYQLIMYSCVRSQLDGRELVP